MKLWRATCLSLSLLALSAPLAMAGAQDDIDAVAKAERDFAADTKANGFHRGFIAWSTDNAIGFLPEAANYHAGLVADLAADPTLADKPTKLRWRPYYIAADGDLAFDLGPWTVEGGDRAGWYFTIWQRQADGSWKWALDGGCGSDTLAGLPPDGAILAAPPAPAGGDAATPAQGLAQDDTYNGKLATTPYAEVVSALPGAKPGICSGTVPYIPGFVPSGADAEAIKASAVAARPAPGLTWSRDGYGASKSGTFVYTYGRAVTADGAYKGHYVRVWNQLGAGRWALVVDLFHE